MNEKELYMKNIEVHGVMFQIDKAIEECLELSNALLRFKQDRKNNVEEEVADVEIMCNQLRMMFNEDLINFTKDYKLKRLEKILKL